MIASLSSHAPHLAMLIVPVGLAIALMRRRPRRAIEDPRQREAKYRSAFGFSPAPRRH